MDTKIGTLSAEERSHFHRNPADNNVPDYKMTVKVDNVVYLMSYEGTRHAIYPWVRSTHIQILPYS